MAEDEGCATVLGICRVHLQSGCSGNYCVTLAGGRDAAERTGKS